MQINSLSSNQSVPLVTVGIPTHNRARLLPRALDTLLAQTCQNIEFVVSDNASIDDTEKILAKYVRKDGRVRYIRQKKNIGAIANHEFVLRRARGKYFMWASDDDEWDPRFVEVMVRALEENPEYGVAMSHYNEKRLYSDGHIETLVRTHFFTHRSYQDVFYHHFRHGKSPIFTFGLFRTDLLKKIHERPTAITFQGTLPMLAEAALATKFYSVPEVLHTRLQDMRSRLLRHPAEHPFSYQEFVAIFPFTRYFLIMFWRLATSSVIPFSRKRLFLKPWFQRVWLKKWRIAQEFKWWFCVHFFRKSAK